MQYTEQTVEVATLETPKREITTVPIPGQFGAARSLIASLSLVADPANEGGFAWWWMVTSVSGSDWIALPTRDDAGVRVTQGESTSLRLIGPFGDRLAVQFVTRLTKQVDDRYSVYARWNEVRLRLGVQLG